MVLDVRQLSYAISREWTLLNRISLSADTGEIVGIFGENGCGKTTLLQILAGAFPACNGKILYRRNPTEPPHEVQAWPLWRRARAGILYVPQENRIWPEMTVVEHLDLGCDGAFITGDPVVTRDDVLNVLPGTHMAGELSHGQQRFLLLMRALILAPRVLLADEPLAGLDKELQQVAAARIRALLERGMCAIVVEHDQDALAMLGARLIKLEEGAIHAV